jgi:predicted Fe-S protein YdhL (DUF1289 family)
LTAGVPSPCVGICIVDDARVCIGCRRSLDEIAAWSTATNEQKRRVLDAAASRVRDPAASPVANRSPTESCADLSVNPPIPSSKRTLNENDSDHQNDDA